MENEEKLVLTTSKNANVTFREKVSAKGKQIKAPHPNICSRCYSPTFIYVPDKAPAYQLKAEIITVFLGSMDGKQYFRYLTLCVHHCVKIVKRRKDSSVLNHKAVVIGDQKPLYEKICQVEKPVKEIQGAAAEQRWP